MKCIDPEAPFPFFGYRRLNDDARLNDVCPTLAHFFEAEKFRGVDEGLRQEVLLAPTPRAARKITRRCSSDWRQDWSRMRPRVFAAGLAMQMAQHVDVLTAARATAENALALSSSKEKVGGYPVSFVAGVTSTLLSNAVDKSAIRLAITTIAPYAPIDIESRLDALFVQRLPLSATVYVGADAHLSAERWCMTRCVPIRFIGMGSSRLRHADHGAGLLARCSTLVVCAPGSRQEIKLLLAAAKKSRVKVVAFSKPHSESVLT